ncbi:MAG: CHAD domain-containing protein [Bacteroidales bacterium]|nr:CHAD domain-containing protein [Bacteroidales bacterium]
MMNKKETGEFLYRYYRKRIASFLASMYKASITCDANDIHKVRVDIKKIFALFHLFEMVIPDTFKKENHYPELRDIFNHSGFIREIQINLHHLDNAGIDNPEIQHFREYLTGEEGRLTKEFLTGIKNFDEKKLKQAEKEIKKITSGISQKKFLNDTVVFIRKKSKKIAALHEKGEGPGTIHKIRRQIKSITAITDMALTLRPDEKLKQLTGNMTRVEILIGEWHDDMVLLDSIKYFRTKILKKKAAKNQEPLFLADFEEILNNEISDMLKQIGPSIDQIILEISALFPMETKS